MAGRGAQSARTSSRAAVSRSPLIAFGMSDCVPAPRYQPTFCVHDTRWAKRPYCCDFAFVSEDLAPRVRAISVDLDTKVSDHQPVLLDVDAR